MRGRGGGFVLLSELVEVGRRCGGKGDIGWVGEWLADAGALSAACKEWFC